MNGTNDKGVKVMTNFERIKLRTIEETADYIYSHDDALLDEICKSKGEECPFGDDVESVNCKGCIKKWLESEVEE